MSGVGTGPGDGQPHSPHRGHVSWVRTASLMGTVVGIHVVSAGPLDDDTQLDRAAREAFGDLEHIEEVFTPFNEGSDIRRLARGDLSICDADPQIMEVLDLCMTARSRTWGLFDPWWRGWFDPTGIVKGWAVEQTTRRHLAPLVASGLVDAVGINAGGDMQLLSAEETTWTWNVGIADPFTPGATVGRLSLRSGAVATSGTAERGSHIIDPRSSHPARSVASATVVAQSLTEADLWATVACVAGFDDMSWVRDSTSESALVVGVDHGVRRWVGDAADATPPGAAPTPWISEQERERRHAS